MLNFFEVGEDDYIRLEGVRRITLECDEGDNYSVVFTYDFAKPQIVYVVDKKKGQALIYEALLHINNLVPAACPVDGVKNHAKKTD